MRYVGLLDPGIWRREQRRWIEAAAPGPADGRDPEPVASGRSRLVVARDDRVLDESGRPRPEVVRTLVAKGLLALTGAPDERRAWTSLLPMLAPSHVIGLKLNTVAVHLVPHREVVDAVVASLGTAAVRPDHIVIWDNLGSLGPLRMRLYGNVERPEGAYYQGMARAGWVPDGSAA